jgi:succinoglycan biosynthesis transport protein ExoP
MNNLEKYLDQVIEQRPAVSETPPMLQAPKPNVVQGVLRRWYIALVVTLVLAGLGVPAIWLIIEPQYVVMGALNVAPAVKDILTGKPDYGDITAYGNFVNTQAATLTSGGIVLKVADDLAGRNLTFFSGAPQTRLDKVRSLLGVPAGNPEPAAVLKTAIQRGIISARYIPETTWIGVTMKGQNANEAKQIVDSFLQNYVLWYQSESSKEDTQSLSALEERQRDLNTKIKGYHDQIRQLASDYGTTELTAHQQMEMERETTLLAERTRLEAKKIDMEATIGLLEKTERIAFSPEQAVADCRDYVMSDPTVRELSASVVQMERDLMVSRASLSAGNQVLDRQEELLATFKKSLEDKRNELEDEFYDRLDRRLEDAAQLKLQSAQAEHQQVLIHLQKIDEVLSAQDARTQKIGRDNLDIRDIQFRLDLDTEIYDQVSRRIKTLQMEQEQRPRVRVDRLAEVDSIEDKRIPYSAAVLFVAFGCGCGLAFLRDKADKTLHNPDDLSRDLGLPLLGTTINSHALRPEMFAEQIASDYQTIRTNLGLITSGGMPRRLTVSSPGVREGKTTFAVNLATSLAKSGKKVLLIDGDLRKPDIRHMLNMPNGTPGVQEVLLGEDPSGIVRTVPGSGLHVLVANSRSRVDAYELLTSPGAAEQIEKLGREYDHLIIDTPPALAFPDALIWAKLTDAVVLVSFAGQTTSPDLKEARDRFLRIRARVLGAVLSNVRLEQSLYRYNYSYVGQGAGTARRARKSRKLLLASQQSQDKTPSPEA